MASRHAAQITYSCVADIMWGHLNNLYSISCDWVRIPSKTTIRSSDKYLFPDRPVQRLHHDRVERLSRLLRLLPRLLVRHLRPEALHPSLPGRQGSRQRHLDPRRVLPRVRQRVVPLRAHSHGRRWYVHHFWPGALELSGGQIFYFRKLAMVMARE